MKINCHRWYFSDGFKRETREQLVDEDVPMQNRFVWKAKGCECWLWPLHQHQGVWTHISHLPSCKITLGKLPHTLQQVLFFSSFVDLQVLQTWLLAFSNFREQTEHIGNSNRKISKNYELCINYEENIRTFVVKNCPL